MRRQLIIFWALFAPAFAYAENQHPVWVVLNNTYKGKITIGFIDDFPCLKRPLLEEWGFRTVFLDKASWDDRQCLRQETLKASNINYYYDNIAQLVTIVAPKTLVVDKQAAVSTSRWNDGINAAFVNYHANYNWQKKGPRNPYIEHSGTWYLDLDSGVNVGPWRFRYQNSVLQDAYGKRTSYTRNILLTRAIRPLRGKLQIGDSISSSSLFDSIGYRGVQLGSDESMMPDSWRPFSPWLKGYAKSNAEVTVSQGGLVIYKTSVPPGPFTLRGIHPPAADGNIEMTIEESDGTETTRVLPYSSMPNLVHSGNYTYHALLGRYRPWRGADDKQQPFGQWELSWGLPAGVSFFGGMIQSAIYRSYAVGMGKTLKRFGAVSFDVTQSRAEKPHNIVEWGKVLRLRYARAFLNTETSLSVQMRYHPAGQKFRTLQQTIQEQSIGHLEPEKKFYWEVYLNQNLRENASLWTTLVQQSYHNKWKKQTSWTLGYSDTLHDIDINVSAGYNKYPGDKGETEVNFSVSVPFYVFGAPKRFSHLKLNYEQTVGKNVTMNQGVSVSGSAFDDYSLNYNFGGQYDSDNMQTVHGNVSYQYNAGEIALSATNGSGTRQYGADLAGSVLIHRDGITLGQTLGATPALVQVVDTPGIGVVNQFGVTTDRRGYALISNLTPWRVNRLSVDTLTLPNGVDLPLWESEVVPTEGAITFAKFIPVKGKKEEETALSVAPDATDDREASDPSAVSSNVAE